MTSPLNKVNKVAGQETSMATKVNKVLKWQLLTAAGAMTLLAGADCQNRLSHHRINLAGDDCQEFMTFRIMQRASSVSSTNQTLLTLLTLVAPRQQTFNLIHLCDAPSNTGALADNAPDVDK